MSRALAMRLESDDIPQNFTFDVAIVAIGYERRCRWLVEKYEIKANKRLGLEFGFLREGSYNQNRLYFELQSYQIIDGVSATTAKQISETIALIEHDVGPVRVFVDISSMSREMIANVVLGIQSSRTAAGIHVTVGYAPSKFSGTYHPAPIRLASPIKPALAGWSSQPERSLGAIFGLGCEPGLALGALQFLEPKKAWIFSPKGIEQDFDIAMRSANKHIDEIFDATTFIYEITKPTLARGRFESLLNAIEGHFRVIAVPFGPKIFAWLSISTVVFTGRSDIGVWAFSSKESARMVDRDALGAIVWHSFSLDKDNLAH
jgi:hypothetical protein